VQSSRELNQRQIDLETEELEASPEEEKKLWDQLTDIIWLLGKLPEVNVKQSKDTVDKLTLRTCEGNYNNWESKRILKNVQHPLINNSIVIKSVLN
jgi:Asp-tRNA(Asn)/Glu-tRNA(Gln) amidotransferase C subunit